MVMEMSRLLVMSAVVFLACAPVAEQPESSTGAAAQPSAITDCAPRPAHGVWQPCDDPGGDKPFDCDPAYHRSGADPVWRPDRQPAPPLPDKVFQVSPRRPFWHTPDGVIHRLVPRNDSDPLTPEEGFQNWLTCAVDQIVVHRCETRDLQSCHDILTGRTAPKEIKGAHFLVASDGRILQLAPVEYGAYHCGTQDRVCNCRSIGIEHEGNVGEPISDVQLRASAWLVGHLCRTYRIPCAQAAVIGHNEAPDAYTASNKPRPARDGGTVPPDQKRQTSCPAEWPWEQYRGYLSQAFAGRLEPPALDDGAAECPGGGR
jgi:hypothetical protein